jgi:hypothetical protein
LGHSNRAMTKRYVRQNPERLRKGLREKWYAIQTLSG